MRKLTPKKIVITGAGGYIGSKMVDTFVDLGYHVIALDRFFFGNTLDDLAKHDRVTLVRDDTRYFKKSILKGAYAVIDLAGISNDPSAHLDVNITMDINVKGSIRVAQLAKEMNVQRYIFSSSSSVYGHGEEICTEKSKTVPLSEYSRSKLLAETDLLKLRTKQFSVTCLRNATVYGLSKRRTRFDLIVNLMTLNAWKERRIFILGGGKQWRPLVHIDDCIEAFRVVMEEPEANKVNGHIFNVGSNEQNFQVFQIANKMKKFFSGLVVEEVPSDPEQRDYRVDFSKIRSVLSYTPTKTVEDGIIEILASLDKGEIIDDLTTRTHPYYQYLMQAEKILSGVKLKGRLFI